MNEQNVIDSCEHLIDFHAWDPSKIDPRGWLRNFTNAERPLASILLSRFTYYADHLVNQLFKSAFQSLSNPEDGVWRPYPDAQAKWSQFCQTAFITIVQGETPNPSDSGWVFARKARQVLGVPEERLLLPAQALELVTNNYPGAIIFVDDFVGSGEQFMKTWKRIYPTSRGFRSFEKTITTDTKTHFYYCNAMTTMKGRKRIADDAPNVIIAAGNVVPYDHSLSSSSSVLWPSDVRDDGIALIKEKSFNLGYKEDDGGLEDWEGFNKLGLGLAFAHSVPDATLPIFHADKGGWTPLVRRS